MPVELAHAQGPWHAGYLLYGYETYAEEGVKGEIYTINAAGTSGFDSMYEWVTIVLSYYNLYWLQLGYVKSWRCQPIFSIKYYFEKSDMFTGGPAISIDKGPGPSPGTWHKYYITHPYGYGESEYPNLYFFYIDGTLRFFTQAWPYESKDQQAAAETTSTHINIDGSHFKGLSLFTLDKYWVWRRWGTHQPYVDSPYHLTEVSNYEFYADGGG